MPEYLAPGVYIEEVEIGARPIEGVSTSTGGFLGYAERGPLNTPTLVTSFAQFQSVFGGFLPAEKGSTDLSQIRWLAYAVSAFFENGGKRVYVTRVASLDNADTAIGYLPDISGDTIGAVLTKNAHANDYALQLSEDAGFSANNTLLLKDGNRSEYLTFEDAAHKILLRGAATFFEAHSAGALITNVTSNSTADAELGSIDNMTLELSNVASGVIFAENDYLLIDNTNAIGDEVVVVDEVLAQAGTTATITITEPLQRTQATGRNIYKLTRSTEATILSHVSAGESTLYVADSTGFVLDDTIIIGNEYYNIKAPQTTSDAIRISPPLKYDHSAGNDVILVEETPAITVTAASNGTWGDSLKVSVIPSSISSTQITEAVSGGTDRLDLETITGIEEGSVLKLTAASDTYLVTVKEIHKTDTETYVVLENTFTGTLAIGDKVETQEFDLYISDGSNEELFKNLSLNSQHSRFFGDIITEKSSNLVRVEAYTGSGDTIGLPTSDDGMSWFLSGGDDGFPTNERDMNTIYAGEDSIEPVNRTGLNTFKNIDDINIAAIPGITTKYLQQKLVNHCEVAMKDRFAVLDSVALAGLDEVKAQRNLFDSSYGALYYPWLYAFDPLSKGYINMPPSGFVSGIYARADVERGVHKAPANEKVNGVVNTEKLNGKYRIIDKGTQDVLNPLGVNCIRSFPGRGIRVWGARTMSSNSLWKYVNVRRLFLFLEESIENGTQWVVFEPNDPKLWARVKQTISQFLTSVWKSGALMGNTPDDAFFIKCDDTTMTPSDINNGRLVVQVGVAPVKPAEFVIFRIAQWQGGSAATE